MDREQALAFMHQFTQEEKILLIEQLEAILRSREACPTHEETDPEED